MPTMVIHAEKGEDIATILTGPYNISLQWSLMIAHKQAFITLHGWYS